MKRLMLLLISVLLLNSCLGPNVGDYRVKLLPFEDLQLDEVEKWALTHEGKDAAIVFAGDKNYESFLQLNDAELFLRLNVDDITIRHEGEQLILDVEEGDLRDQEEGKRLFMHLTSRTLPAPKTITFIVAGRSIPLNVEIYE